MTKKKPKARSPGKLETAIRQHLSKVSLKKLIAMNIPYFIIFYLVEKCAYSYLTLIGKLWTYLADLNEQCVERRDFLMNQIMEQEGITEKLKSRDQMEWVRQANNVRSRVDEIVLNELVYV